MKPQLRAVNNEAEHEAIFMIELAQRPSRLLTKYHERVQVQSVDECWLWLGVKMKGYGHFYARTKVRLRAHRVAFFLEHGRWPRPLCRHTCDNPSCCNPAHLLEGTHSDNVRDMVARGRGLTGSLNPAVRRPETRPRGEGHCRARFTNGDIEVIRQRCRAGETRTAIAVDYNVNRSTIGRAVSGKTWSHI